VLVGDASVFAKDLSGVGFDQVERIPLAELDLSAPDLRRHTAPGPSRLEPVAFRKPRAAELGVALDDARQVIARAVAAKGGLDLLRSIQTVRVESVATVQSDGINTDLPSTTTIRYPGAFRTDTTTPAGPLVQVFNAGRYWVQDRNGVHDAPESMAALIRGNVQRDTVPLLLALNDGKITASLSESTEEGRRMPVLEVALPGNTAMRLVFDPSTALLSKVNYRVPSPSGEVNVEEIYSDYRDVHGLKVAFTTEVRRDGAPAVRRTVRSFEFNVPVDPSIFNKPS
jgi:hypothetical protein